MPDAPTVFFDSFGSSDNSSSWRFGGYVTTLMTIVPEEVGTILRQVERATTGGLYAAGFVAYEAAAALNPDLPARQPAEGLPLVWFALFRERHSVTAGGGIPLSSTEISLTPQQTFEEYTGNVERIRDYIAAGDCYQVNYTFPLQGTVKGDLPGLYSRISHAQQAPFCALIDTGRFTILSASPELFFSLKEGIITTRPMKGTAARGCREDEDLDAIQQLRNNSKEKAENVMIVDLLRSDLGSLAETGSVSVDALFDVETYPSVHQMTSTISAQLRADTGLTDIFRALFPCGSVTGAPKRRSMQIIDEREAAARGVYCGAIGSVAPRGDAVFSVAIRTLIHDAETDGLTMGIGSAITWDSQAASEYAECLSKALFVTRANSDFKLVESLRLEQGTYTLLERHMTRLLSSARFFGFQFDEAALRRSLASHAAQTDGLHKVRLLLTADATAEITSELLQDTAQPLRTAISAITVNSKDTLRYHKTTRRELFDRARAERPDCDEVLLLNENGQLTEGSYHNLVIHLNGALLTPPLACGLLPGVLREELLAQGIVTERLISPEDLKRADEIWLINSVRGWRRCDVI
ncbi:MAG TPA: aminodeoxychorismate synthase component I [Desulfuromonadales bacterium]|nr:aminodeoxychorismate synthase component I [Desulfuromonadales bacterium]